MASHLAIDGEVQLDDVGLLADDPRLLAALEGEGDRSAEVHRQPWVSPAHGEHTERLSACGNVNPCASSQFMPIRQHDAGIASDVSIHFLAPYSEPASRNRPLNSAASARTQARRQLGPRFTTRAGHFSFHQLPEHLEADFPDMPHVAVLLPAAAGAGAAIMRPPPAKSRPFPFLQINHVAHQALPSDWDRSRVRFAPLQKAIAA